MDLFPSLSMFDFELNDPLGSSEFDLSSSFENTFGLAGGSDLLSEIFNDDQSFSSYKTDNAYDITLTGQLMPIYPTISRQRANRSSNQAKRNRVRMKAKTQFQQQQQQKQNQQQQQHQNQQRQFSSIFSNTNISSNNLHIGGRSLIHNTQQQQQQHSLSVSSAKVSLQSRQQQSTLNLRSGTTDQKPALMPRVYFMQQSPKKQVKSVLSPAKKSHLVAPSVGVSTSQQELSGNGISLLLKPQKKKSQKKLNRENALRKRRFFDALCEHDYDKDLQNSLDLFLPKEIEQINSEEQSTSKKNQDKKSSGSNIRSEQQRLHNDFEDIANGFIPDDVLLNELPNCLQDLVEGFGEAMLKENSTEDILDGLTDACNFMQDQFIDELIGASDIPDFNLTEDELNQMIGFVDDSDSKEEVEDSAIESASDALIMNTDKSEPDSVATSECDEESDFFDGKTLALALTTNSNIKRNRKSSGSSSTRRKRRFSSRSSVASDSANSDSGASSIEPDSESNSSRPSSPDSMGCYGKVQFRKHPNKKIPKPDGNVNEKVLFIGNIPSGFKKADLRSLFSKFGSIERIEMFSNSALVTYESANQTRNAIKYGNDERRHAPFSLSFGKERQSSPRQKFVDLDLFEDNFIDFRIDGREFRALEA